MQGTSHDGIMLSRVQSSKLPMLTSVKHCVTGLAPSMLIMHVLLYCVSWFLSYLCACFCNKIISEDNCHFGGWCIDCKVEIYFI